jgi:hypothetical protein
MSTRHLTAAALAALTLAGPLAGQGLRSRIEGAPDGVVRLSFAAKEGVCGNGRNISTHRGSDRDGWVSDCEAGPVRVVFDVHGGAVTGLRTYVGGRWREAEGRATDLGTVGAREAAAYLLDLAERGSAKGDPVLPAVLADSVTVWPELVRLARQPAVRRDVRRQAIFWTGQEAGQQAMAGLREVVENDPDSDIRQHAVFALSQIRNGGGVPALMELARSSPHPDVRKRAIFWLGQSDDPRALALFEEILTRKPQLSPPSPGPPGSSRWWDGSGS